jgi:hypothetical protein
MTLRLFTAVALTLLCGIPAFAAGEPRGPQTIGASMVTWNDNRLTAELKNLPVKGVLKDLMSGEGFACQVTGDLEGTISVIIDNLTVEEAIHKILRNRRYDYTMILAEPGSPGGWHSAVSEVTIYQGANTVRFTQVPKGLPAAELKRAEPAPTPTPAFASTKEPPDRTTRATEDELEELDRELKSLMDEMVGEKKMSRQEYDEALRTIDDKKK